MSAAPQNTAQAKAQANQTANQILSHPYVQQAISVGQQTLNRIDQQVGRQFDRRTS